MITAFLPGAGWFSGIFGSFSNVAAGFISGVVTSGNLQGGLWGAFSAGLFEGIGAKFADVVKENAAAKVANLLENGLTRGQFAAKVFAHGMAGGVMSALQGGKFGHGFLSAGVTQAASMRIDGIDRLNKGFSAARVMAAAMVGGTVSAATGGKFANGALTAAFARAHNDEQESLALRMRKDIAVDGTSGVDINLLPEEGDPRDVDLHRRLKQFPRIPGTKVIAGHADPAQPLLIDKRSGSPRAYSAADAAAELIATGLHESDSILVIGCGAGSSGFSNELFKELQSRGYSNPITAPVGNTAPSRRVYRGQTHIFFPEYNGTQSLGYGTRVRWSTVGEQR